MEKYNLLIELNRKLSSGEDISAFEKENAVSVFLKGICPKEELFRYKKSMRVNPDTDNSYPLFYIPPYNGGKKLRLIQGYLPKTYILYANHYELEILRLLYLFAPEDEVVGGMVKATLQRLKGTCFGNSCTKGECFATGISVLRFLAVVCPEDRSWIDKLRAPLEEYISAKEKGQAAVRRDVPVSYLRLAFTDISNEKTTEWVSQKNGGQDDGI